MFFLFDNYFISYFSLFLKLLFHSLPPFRIEFKLQELERRVTSKSYTGPPNKFIAGIL